MQMIVEVKKRAKKAKIKAKKDVLAVYKCHTVNNSPKITPKKVCRYLCLIKGLKSENIKPKNMF